MPEGHLIHHYARAHSAQLRGPLAVTSPQGRFGQAHRLDGLTLRTVEAYGKHLFYRWEDDSVVHVHLGRLGLFVHHIPPAPPPRPQVRLRMDGAQLVVDLIAPARCDAITAQDRAAVVARLGSDPLRDDADVERVRARITASRTPIGALLLDQSVIAGVGNVLRAEVLNMARIHPSQPAASLTPQEVDRLWRLLVSVMSRAADEGRILTAAPDDPQARREIPDREGRFVYRQARCRRCDTPVEELTIGGRTAYTCPSCQTLDEAADRSDAQPR